MEVRVCVFLKSTQNKGKQALSQLNETVESSHTQKRKGHLHHLIQPWKLLQVPSTTRQMGDGGLEPRSIPTCKKDTSLEMITSWNERCSSPPDLSLAKAGHAEWAIPCHLCAAKGVSEVLREVNQLTEVLVCCPHPITALQGWKLHGTQSRGAAASGRTSPSEARTMVAAVALCGKSRPETRILGAPGTPCPLSPRGYKVERGAGGHGGRGSCSL